MEWLVAIITVSAAIITIIWFVRDVRKENSKVLKIQSDILAKIEEGQRKGFQTLEEGQTKLAGIQTKGFEALAQILAKIEAK